MRVVVIGTQTHPHAQHGEVLDLPETEALSMIANGTAVPAETPEEPPAELPGEPLPDSKPEPELARTPTKKAPSKAARKR